jgi:hypothetical protein
VEGMPDLGRIRERGHAVPVEGGGRHVGNVDGADTWPLQDQAPAVGARGVRPDLATILTKIKHLIKTKIEKEF